MKIPMNINVSDNNKFSAYTLNPGNNSLATTSQEHTDISSRPQISTQLMGT